MSAIAGTSSVAASSWTEDEPRYADPEPQGDVPVYSPMPRGSDVSLQPAALELFSPDSIWRYSSKHLSVNLGTRLWGMSIPTYGLHGQIAGNVQVFGLPETIGDVDLTLEGVSNTWIPTTASSSHYALTFLSQTVSLQPIPSHDSSCECKFSIPIPPEVNIQGVLTPTPASFFQDRYGAICDISYSLKVNVQGKGRHKALKTVESKVIPLLYLPKSRPSDPPLHIIPRPGRAHGGQTPGPNFQVSDHVNTLTLSPWWWSAVHEPNQCLDTFKNSVFFSLPSPQTYASGEDIPFLLSLVFPNDPVLAIMYSRRITIKLVKQLLVYPVKSSHKHHHHHHPHAPRIFTLTRSRSVDSREPKKHTVIRDVHLEYAAALESRRSLSSNSSESETEFSWSSSRHSEPVIREWAISSGQPRLKSEYSEGVCVLRGWIDGAEAGRESSWSLGSIVKVQYVIRAFVSPPDHLEEHLPRFTCEQVVDLTTDSWEVDDREVRSMGGLPAPALGLVKDLRPEL